MINTILSLFILEAPVSAGSICNDGTYSYSEGRGTCSHHGGVSVSGVYQNHSQPDASVNLSYPIWDSKYDVTQGGVPYYYSFYSYKNDIFGYSCFVFKNNTPGEAILFIVNEPKIANSVEYVAAPEESIRVLAHTKYGYKLISGSWEWRSEDEYIFIRKSNSSLESLVEPLSKIDMNNIVFSDHFLVSIAGRQDSIILVPGITQKVIETWSKCKANK
jgi:hypothetical protein